MIKASNIKEIDKLILFDYMKEQNFNVHDYIHAINTWDEKKEHNNYTMMLKVPMSVISLDDDGYTEKKEIILTDGHFFTINKAKFDEFYKKEIRTRSINILVDEK